MLALTDRVVLNCQVLKIGKCFKLWYLEEAVDVTVFDDYFFQVVEFF
jgi:hypothetical protein